MYFQPRSHLGSEMELYMDPWFQYVRRKYATANNFPCLITLSSRMGTYKFPWKFYLKITIFIFCPLKTNNSFYKFQVFQVWFIQSR